MPDLRAFVIAVGVGGGVGGYLTFWWHWPLAIAWGIGLVLGGLVLVGTMSVARDPGIADRAWRAAAPDLVAPPAVPPAEAEAEAATPTRSRDLPSGD
ncbi:MAG: hypothetical protein HY264_04480 [Chloroflexi bacterium]|nr:hypothetical protein [Chloroflexota bacterium]